jgi:hypothetical protein
MITRETKVGLVVASSFVCLVGIVLISKLLREEAPVADGSASAVGKGVAAARPGSALPPAGKGGKSAGGTPLKNSPSAQKTSPAKAPIVLVSTTPVEKATTGSEGASGKGNAGIEIVAPAPAGPKETEKEAASAIVPAGPIIVEAGPKAGDSVPASAIKNEKADPEKEKGLVVEAGKENDKVAAAKNKNLTNSLMEQVKKKNQDTDEIVADSGAAKKEAASANPILEVVSGLEKKDSTEAKAAGPKKDPAKAEAVSVIAPIATKTESDAEKKAAPVISGQEPAKLAAAIPVPTAGVGDPTQKGTLPTIPAEKPAPDKLPVLGAPNTVDSRPITVAPATIGKGIPAKVESFDYWSYASRQGDTFAGISQTYYKSDRYGAALREFNQKHPLAARTPQHDPPNAGQKVIVPDLAYLEEHYSGMVPERAPLKIGRPEALIASPIKEEVRPVRTIRAVTDNAVVPVAGAKASAGGGTYVVRGATERLWFIAKETLGDPNRWPEIYRLNPQVAPEGYVAQGTELRLPVTAPSAR